MAAARRGDEPWRRLPLLVPVAVVVALLSVTGFLSLLVPPPTPPKASDSIEMGMVELTAPEQPPIAAPRPGGVEATPTEPDLAPPAPNEPSPEPEAKVAPLQPQLVSPTRPQKRPPRPHPPNPSRQAAPAGPPSTLPHQPGGLEPSGSASAPPAESSLSPGGGSTGARAIFQPMPQIPDELRRRRLDVVAVVVFRIAPDGSAMVELREATDDPHLNQVLLDGFRLWRFFPALVRDQPVASILELRIPIQIR